MRVLETVRIVTPFGLRLRSEVTGETVARGIEVTIGEGTGVAAVANPSGVFVARRVRGIVAADLEADDWAGISRPTRIAVTDRLGRYLPYTARVPLPHRGLLTRDLVDAGSPPPSEAALPLFPSPSFRATEPLAEVRVQLSRPDGSAIAWALVRVEVAGRMHRGLTDARGVGLVAFPWPPPSSPTLASSPPEPREHRWPLTLRVWSDVLPAARPPDLSAVLAQERGSGLAPVCETSGSPPDPLMLVYSRPLVLLPASLVPA